MHVYVTLNKNKNVIFFGLYKDLSCVVSCPAGRGFAVQPPQLYNCSGKGGIWQPHKRVPECMGKLTLSLETLFLFNIKLIIVFIYLYGISQITSAFVAYL